MKAYTNEQFKNLHQLIATGKNKEAYQLTQVIQNDVLEMIDTFEVCTEEVNGERKPIVPQG